MSHHSYLLWHYGVFQKFNNMKDLKSELKKAGTVKKKWTEDGTTHLVLLIKDTETEYETEYYYYKKRY